MYNNQGILRLVRYLRILVEKFQLLDMVLDMVEIGQSHVVAELRLEHVVTVAGNRQPDTLELVGGKRENVLLVIDDVERDAEVVGQRLAARQTAETAQYGKRDMAVEPREGSDLA